MTRKWIALSGRRLRRVGALAAIIAIGCLGFILPNPSKAQRVEAPGAQLVAPAQVVAAYGRVPMSFEANAGQVKGRGSERVQFLSRGRGYTLFLSGDEAVLKLAKRSQKSEDRSQKDGSQLSVFSSQSEGHGESRTSSPESRAPAVVRLKFEHANPQARVVGVDELPGKANYFIGQDSQKWRTNVSTYGRVKAEEIYAGIDVVYYGRAGELEYDLVVAPGADPKAIALKIETGNSKLETRKSKREIRNSKDASPESRTPDSKSVRIAANGDLVIETGGEEVRLKKPVVYQEQSSVVSGQLSVKADHGRQTPENHQSSIENRKFLDARYVLCPIRNPKSKIPHGDEVSFEIASYDRTRPLIIDPVLTYSTYLGGNSGEIGYGIAVDSSGNAYVTGSTISTDFPKKGSLQASSGGDADAFITKLSASGATVVYSTYLGGSGLDQANAIALDSSRNVYVTGQTQSTDFPTSAGAFGTTAGGNGDAFVVKLSAAGSALTYSTYLGGGGADFGQGIAVDSNGNAYVAGSTQSADFPTATPLQSSRGGTADAFVAKLKADGTGLVYSTYLGGGGSDVGLAIALDGSANAYVAGNTASTNFPTTAGVVQKAPGGGSDAYVSKLNAKGSALVYSTYLGGSAFDRADAIAVDSSGSAYVTGLTNSSNFPAVSALQGTAGGNGDAFVAKLNTDGSALAYSTYLGGVDVDEGFGIAVDSLGAAFITGFTQSDDFPVTDAVQANFGGGVCGSGVCPDVFVSQLSSAGSPLTYSTFLGGSGADFGQAIAVDSSGNAYVTGSTMSTKFPVIVGAFQPVAGGSTATADAFVSKIAPASAPSVSLSPLKVTFGNTTSGTSSAAKAVTMTNYGSAALPITNISISGPFSQSNTCGTSLAGNGARCTISIKFNPTTVGALTGTLTVSDGAAGSPHKVSLTGTGTAPAPIVKLSPTSLDFGDQVFGIKSSPKTVTLTNSGSANLAITAFTIGGTNFALTHDCPKTLAASASCTLTVTFKPTKTGGLTDSLDIVDNATGTPHRVALKGNGVAVFTLASNPASLTLSRSAASPTFKITATAPSSFTGDIQLTCSAASPASCSLNPTTIKAGETSTLTLTGFAASTGDFTLSVAGTSGDQSKTVGVAITFTNFALGISPSLITIAAGKSATYAVSLKPLNGFKEETKLTCGFFLVSTDAASCFLRPLQNTSCAITPASVTPDGTQSSKATVTITTSSASSSMPAPLRPGPPTPLIVWVSLLLAAGIAVIVRRKSPGYSLPLATVLLLLVLSTSCDTTFTPLFQGPAAVKGTPGGLFLMGVAGTAGTTMTHCAAANLGVNTTTTTP